MTLADMSEQEQVRYFQMVDELVSSRTMDETTADAYAVVCCARAREYREKVASMKLPLYLIVWAKEMQAAHKTEMVKCHHNYLPWVEAFLVSRYGEAVASWPAELSEQDIKRAREWKTKSLPAIVKI